MADNENNTEKKSGKDAVGSQPIIIKKVKKGGGGHHGGAWKVAYADFVTSMMAFFLLLWLLSVTTDVQKKGIAEYFSPTIKVSETSGGTGIFGGSSPFHTDTQVSAADPFGFMVNHPKAANGTQTGQGKNQKVSIDQQHAKDVAAQIEQEQFKKAEEDLKEKINSMPELKALKNALLIDTTPEGLRIQIVDQDKRPMFPLGSSDMYDYTKQLLELVAKVVQKLPNKISISGHTDATPYHNGSSYTNWELSADRANASRRVLITSGVDPQRIQRVEGLADRDPLLADDPTNARNRRITILLMRRNGPAANSAGGDDSAQP